MNMELLDVVALTNAIPERNLAAGSVGTIVEILDENHCEVEFSDKNGECYALFAVQTKNLIVLRYEPIAA